MRNSWGADWGDGGYFWVSYYDRSFARDQGLGGYGGCTSYATVEGTDNYASIYQYDDLGVTDHWGYGIPRVWGATRYTAAATQTVSAAGFYTLSSSTRYQVWAGPTLKSLTLRASGVRTLPGYGTVSFSEPTAGHRGPPVRGGDQARTLRATTTRSRWNVPPARGCGRRSRRAARASSAATGPRGRT